MLFLLEISLLTSYAIFLTKHCGRDVTMRYIPIFAFTVLLSLAAVSSLEPPRGFFLLGGVIVSGIISIIAWIPKYPSSEATTHRVVRRQQ